MVGSGNEYFKQDKYPEAIKHYTEALKRNPSDPKVSLWQSTLPICQVSVLYFGFCHVAGTNLLAMLCPTGI